MSSDDTMPEILEINPLTKQTFGHDKIELLQESLEWIEEAQRIRELGFDNDWNRSHERFYRKEFKQQLKELNELAEEL